MRSVTITRPRVQVRMTMNTKAPAINGYQPPAGILVMFERK